VLGTTTSPSIQPSSNLKCQTPGSKHIARDQKPKKAENQEASKSRGPGIMKSVIPKNLKRLKTESPEKQKAQTPNDSPFQKAEDHKTGQYRSP